MWIIPIFSGRCGKYSSGTKACGNHSAMHARTAATLFPVRGGSLVVTRPGAVPASGCSPWWRRRHRPAVGDFVPDFGDDRLTPRHAADLHGAPASLKNDQAQRLVMVRRATCRPLLAELLAAERARRLLGPWRIPHRNKRAGADRAVDKVRPHVGLLVGDRERSAGLAEVAIRAML